MFEKYENFLTRKTFQITLVVWDKHVFTHIEPTAKEIEVHFAPIDV